MDYYTDNSNDRPYKKDDRNRIISIKQNGSSHDYEYWTKMNNKKEIIKNKNGSSNNGISQSNQASL